MPQLGSDRGLSSNIVSGLMDATGENVVSTSIDFGSSPLGIAARTQVLYGLANSNFTLTPPDPSATLLDGENPLPFWSVLEDSEGRITATSHYDTTTETWGVIVDPSSGTAIPTDTLTMKTRSYVISDDNLAVRQKAFLQMAKSGTAGTATQWNLTLNAEYFNAAGSSLASHTIGTALDTASFTTINGFTMSGGSAIPAASQYLDLTVTCTATGTVTGTAKATLKSVLIQTSQPSTGSFTVVETFTSDATWTRPTGVQYISAIVGGAGGGGGGGGLRVTQDPGFGSGGGGGGGGAWVLAENFYVGDQSTITVGIGALGAGGSGRTAGTATTQALSGSAGASGGASTLGSFIIAGGGSGGSGGTAVSAGTVVISGVSGGAAGTVNCAIFGAAIGTPSGGSSGQHNAGTTSVSIGSAGVNSYPGVTIFPFYPLLSASTQGAAGTVLGTGGGAGTGTNGAVSTGAAGGGGGGGGARVGSTNASTVVSAGGAAVGGSGPGGGGAARRSGGTVLISGAGGSAAQYSSSGGGGGGGAAVDITGNTSGSFKSADGGPGAKGLVIIAYTA